MAQVMAQLSYPDAIKDPSEAYVCIVDTNGLSELDACKVVNDAVKSLRRPSKYMFVRYFVKHPDGSETLHGDNSLETLYGVNQI